jgi:adenylyl-sulfate kinase
MDKGFVVWLTGLPKSGKTTIANELAKELRRRGLRVEVLDGNEVRENLSPDLGFSKADRETHAKRVTYISKLLSRNGVAVIVALISPYRSFREHARGEIKNFVEVWVKCPVETCMKRDKEGLYKKALEGKIKDMTGVNDPYETPLKPEVVVDTDGETPNEGADRIIEKLEKLRYIKK